jgi:SAM-dependent methyltransferase
MEEFSLPRSDEPFDFRHQAERYGRWRRDYSPALYDAIEAATGPAAGRRALDVGCGTGFVTRTLRGRGWRVVGADFSAPMLAAARAAGDAPPLVRARGEALPVVSGSVSLVCCGTSFHWLAPAAALAEFRRVLAPGGWVALFWRYAVPGEPSVAVVREAMGGLGVMLPDVMFAHSSAPFGGSDLEVREPILLDTTLEFTPEEFHGYVSTVEWIRRLAGERHAEVLERLRALLAERFPEGLRERNREYLFLARRGGGSCPSAG